MGRVHDWFDGTGKCLERGCASIVSTFCSCCCSSCTIGRGLELINIPISCDTRHDSRFVRNISSRQSTRYQAMQFPLFLLEMFLRFGQHGFSISRLELVEPWIVLELVGATFASSRPSFSPYLTVSRGKILVIMDHQLSNPFLTSAGAYAKSNWWVELIGSYGFSLANLDHGRPGNGPYHETMKQLLIHRHHRRELSTVHDICNQENCYWCWSRVLIIVFCVFWRNFPKFMKATIYLWSMDIWTTGT